MRIERIVPRGLGIGFADGMTIFVPLSVAGDILRARVREVKGRIAFAEVIEVTEPGADRIVPPCRYFGTCGGCDFQQMSYPAQLAAKAGIVADCLRRVGKFEVSEVPIVASPREFGYRSRARWHADASEKRIGYFRRDSHDIVDVAECPILVPELGSLLSEIRSDGTLSRLSSPTAEIDGATDGRHVSMFSRALERLVEPLESTIAGVRFEHSADTFFQANPFLLEQLVEMAVRGLEGDLALDLYCGMGLFSLPLAKRFRSVVGVEEHREAVRRARRNAAENGIDNVTFSTSKVAPYLFANKELRPDAILLDPPRAGVEKWTIQNIIRLEPKKISYVSCEPAGLARDLRKFVDAGYEIESLTAIDLFPQTHHVETVVRLKRR